MEISGVILAGGESKRMGYPKPFLAINGEKMIDIILGKLRNFFTEIIIVTDRKEDFLRERKALRTPKVIEDIIKGCGPLGGIYTGLREMSGDAGFFVGCDMPYLHSGLISRLIAEVDLKRYECIVPTGLPHNKGSYQNNVDCFPEMIPECGPVTGWTPPERKVSCIPEHVGRIEPLHAIYSRQILPKVEIALNSGKLSIRELLANCSCKYVNVCENEISSFVNINTREDLEHCRHL